jgi:trimethylamine--corrinoid protein Co-methyltransferase
MIYKALKAMLEAGRKHIWALSSSSVNLAYQLEMMLAVAGSETVPAERPICHGIVTVLEQFRFPHDEIERLLLYGRYRIPVKVPICPMMGANAPTTIAGTMVQANAEAVASAVLIHYLCPGTPTWYYFFIQAMNERRRSYLSVFTQRSAVRSGCPRQQPLYSLVQQS